MSKKKGKKGYKWLVAFAICAIVCSFATSSMAVYEFIPGSTDLQGTIGKDGKSWQKLYIGNQIWFEGATSNTYETLLYITEPTADRVITFPNSSGTVSLLSGGLAPASSVDSAAIVDGTIRTQDIATGMINSTLLKDGGIAFADLGSSIVNSATVVDNSLTSADILAGTIAYSDLGASIVNATTIKDGSITFADLGSSIINSATIKDGSVGEADLASTAVTAGVTLINTVELAVSASTLFNTATYEANAVLLGVYPSVGTGLVNSMVNTVSYTTGTGVTKVTVGAVDSTARKFKLVFLRP